MSGMQFYILDSETTGVNEKIHEVSEVSIIRHADLKQLTKFIWIEHPERSDPFALETTNRTRETLNQIPQADGSYKKMSVLEHSKNLVVPLINDFLNQDGLTPEHRCIVAHNAKFDQRFLHKLFEKVGLTFPANFWLDTMKPLRALAKKEGLVKPKMKLENVMERMKIASRGTAHTSRSDAQNLYVVFATMLKNGVDYLEYIERKPHE